MSWRPEGWMNPYLQQDNNGDWVSSRAYEAGADAMLRYLRKMGNNPKELLGLTQLFQNHKVVFIPEED